MNAVIFAGPSLPRSKVPSVPGVQWRPPARQGDLYKAALSGAALFGLIDGYFEWTPTVWHKEILWAMAQGTHVYGAASIGALRAAELADFGMQGIGHVYRQFHAGTLVDDDEIAVLHGPEELDYLQVTEAMVNVRATIEHALQHKIVEPAIAAALLRAAKSLFYKDRTYEAILRGADTSGLCQDALRGFMAWLPSGRVDQKRLDALEMVQAIIAHLSRGVSPLEVSYDFAHTFAWEDARRRAENETDGNVNAPQGRTPLRL
jgi:hypothetical protein